MHIQSVQHRPAAILKRRVNKECSGDWFEAKLHASAEWSIMHANSESFISFSAGPSPSLLPSVTVFITRIQPSARWMRRIFSPLQDKGSCRNLGHSLTPCWHSCHRCPAPSHSAQGLVELWVRLSLHPCERCQKSSRPKKDTLKNKSTVPWLRRSARSGPIKNKFVTLFSVISAPRAERRRSDLLCLLEF